MRSAASLGHMVVSVALCAASLVAGSTGEGNPDPDQASPRLEVVDVALLDSRDGFAIPADTQFAGGERVHLYLQVKGYRVGAEDRVHLTYELSALDPLGSQFYPPHQGEYDTELAPQDENWMPIVRYSPLIPEHAGGGTFVIRATVTDELAGSSVSVRVPVRVNAPSFEPEAGLAIQKFRYHYEPIDPEDLVIGDTPGSKSAGGFSCRPGEEFSASFFITGYGVRPDNSFALDSQAWLIGGDGRQLVDFGENAETGAPYYPRRWLRGNIRIQLDPLVAPGDYAVRVRVRDHVAGIVEVRDYPLRVRP